MDAGPGLAVVSRTVAADPHGRREATDRALGSRRCKDRQRQERQAGRRRKQGARNDDDARADEGLSPETCCRWARRLPLFPPRAAPGAGRLRHERGDQATAFDDRPPRDPLRGIGPERNRCATAEQRLRRQRLDLLRRTGPVRDASDVRLGVERPARRAALDQRLGARPHQQRHAGRNRGAGSCRAPRS